MVGAYVDARRDDRPGPGGGAGRDGLPRGTTARTARIAALPLAFTGRAVAGWGRRLAGADPQAVSAAAMERNAEQLFAVLGQLRGRGDEGRPGAGRLRVDDARRAGRAVPPRAGPPAGPGPGDAGARRAPRARRAAGPAVAYPAAGVRRRARRGREHRTGAPGAHVTGAGRRGEGPVPGRGRGPGDRPAGARAVRPAVHPHRPRPRRAGGDAGAAGARARGARLPRRGRPAADVRRGVRRRGAPARPGSGRIGAEGAGVGMARRHVAGHARRPAERGATPTATGTRTRSSRRCSPHPCGWGWCTPTRTPATS